jgi:hypothetical protein
MMVYHMKVGDFFDLGGNICIRLEECKHHIGSVNAVQTNVPGMKCIWGDTEARRIKTINIEVVEYEE